jgi:CO/xanthine dehydrogenase Mo-binding subunit/aerobic-type carbon monoxide dehydrogenase small subunit (CoxS/CutS family)
MADRITFLVNNREVSAAVLPQKNLLDFLRNDLALAGAKRGCNTGHCGACTVIVDGHARRACRVSLANVQGKSIETIEGLSEDGRLHPIQAAFLAAGAVQCGFCATGMIMATKALLAHNPQPGDSEIKEALKHNICRCTGYIKILDAVRLAAKYLKMGEVPSPPSDNSLQGRIGQSFPDYDGINKVKGILPYADDIVMKNMLYGKVLWSEYPHARIDGLGLEKALSSPGVRGIFTAGDIPGNKCCGLIKADQPVLCDDRVRFTGDAVAVVFADSPEQAKQAVLLIDARYQPLQGVFSTEEALQAGAPQVHPGGNTCKHLVYELGDIDQARADSAIRVTGRFTTPVVEHAYLEPEAGIATLDDGTLTVYVPTQFPFEVRQQVAAAMALPPEKVRVVVTPLGGGFGGKCDVAIECLLALGALKLNRPVKISLDREESLRASTKRHAFLADYEVGASAEGKLLYVKAELTADAGPYTALSPKVIDQACIFSCGPYEVPNVHIEGWAVHTNNANGSAMRGFGINQAAVAIESLVDELARKLNMDPFEIRRKNALEVGKKTITGQFLTASVGLTETINRCEQVLSEELDSYYLQYKDHPTKKLGVGLASGFKNVGAGAGRLEDAGAIITLEEDGLVQARVSGVDMGQGFRTAMLQILVESTGLSPDDIHLITGDTLLTPKHSGAAGERQTLINGNAVKIAARKFKEAVLEKAGEIVGLPEENLDLYKNSVILKVDLGPVITLRDLAKKLIPGEEVRGECEYLAPPTYALADVDARKNVSPEDYRNYPSYAYTTQVALVEVDTVNGKVTVLKIIAAHDVGVAINPQKIEGQIEGSLLMGQGYALSEEFVLEKGIIQTTTLGACGIPGITDVPEIQVIIVEDPEPTGPYGAKGISEVATVPIAPAILNAIYDAIGKRVYSLPAKPDNILRLLKDGS